MKKVFAPLLAVTLSALAPLAAPSGAAAATLDEVKERGRLVCGVNENLPGFAARNGEAWQGFDVDFCRAVAAAIFADDTRVDYVPLSAETRFAALAEGKIDLLSRNSTWTLGRELQFGLTFAAVSYYDGQGFMVPRAMNVVSSLDLTGSKVCVLTGTTSEANIPDYFNANNMDFEIVALGSAADILAAYAEGKCNVVTSDVSQLYAWRLQLADTDEHIILPDTISKEPLGPVVRKDDVDWATLVRWVLFALVNAEEMGITSANVGEASASEKPDVRRFAGVDGNLGADLGLANDWTVKTIELVGNYGEMFDRNLGEASPLGIARGLNQLWNLGGILYAPPYR
ncbi:MAG: amino acid ABC transporter substrate-binding protein [Rhizobiaceae bacterium]